MRVGGVVCGGGVVFLLGDSFAIFLFVDLRMYVEINQSARFRR